MKNYVITQEELDTLEAIRLELYKLFVIDDNVNDIIRVSNVTSPLWCIINKKRESTENYIALKDRAKEVSKAFNSIREPKEIYEEIVNLDYALQDIGDI